MTTSRSSILSPLALTAAFSSAAVRRPHALYLLAASPAPGMPVHQSPTVRSAATRIRVIAAPPRAWVRPPTILPHPVDDGPWPRLTHVNPLPRVVGDAMTRRIA